MKKQINLLSSKHLLKNQAVKFPGDKKSSLGKQFIDEPGQVLTWPGLACIKIYG